MPPKAKKAETTGMNRSATWRWTWNNYPSDEEIETTLEKYKYSYYLYGKEICPTTGTPHLQGYMEFGYKPTFGSLQKIHPKISFRTAEAGQKANIDYCTKEGGDIVEKGTKFKQGQRTDLDGARQIIDDGGHMLEVARHNFGDFVRYHRGFAAYQYLVQQEAVASWRDIKVYYYWGVAGSGKTRKVRTDNGRLYCPMDSNTGTWWTGYNQEECILFDDFRGTVPLHTLLKWIDGYPVQVPIHGGATFLNAKKIYFTSNVPLEELYPNCDNESKAALKRRIHEQWFFDENGQMSRSDG